MQLGSMFISNCNNTLHVSDAFLRPSSGALKNCSNSLWCMTWDGVKYPIRASKVDGFRTKSYCVYTIWLSAEALKNCSNSLWCMAWDGVRYPIRASKVDGFRTLDPLIGYFTPSHVINQRLLLQFLSAPEDGRKKASETCWVLLQLLINILPNCITLVLYIYWLHCVCVFSEQTATFVLFNINSLVFITEVESVYSAVRTESLYNLRFVFRGLI